MRAAALAAVLFSFCTPTLARNEGFVECTRPIHTFHGQSVGAQFGWVSAPIPDLDDDGVQEVGVAAIGQGIGGRIYVYSGATGVELFKASGPQNGSSLGTSLRAAGDVNGDGVCDVIAGAPGGNQGRAIVYSGADGSEIHTIIKSGSGTGFGQSVCGIGDVDGDGFDDVAVAAHQNGQTGPAAGKVWIVSGADGDTVLWTINGEAAGDNFGTALGNAGDVTGDGKDDLIVGAANAGPGSRGKAYVYDVANESLWWSVTPDNSGFNFGQFFVDAVGHVNADDVPDIYVSDFSDNQNGGSAGKAYVYDGSTGALIWKLAGDSAGDGFGIGRGAGDVDGDGFDDLILCGWTDSSGASTAGKASIVSGKDKSILREITSTSIGENFGFDAHGMGDVDGDGRLDYFVTATNNSEVGGGAGKCYLLAGGAPLFETGAGIAGTGGVAPTLGVGGCPVPDDLITIDIGGGAAGAVGLLLTGLQPAELPFLGGTLHLVPTKGIEHALDGSGNISFPVTVPGPALVGVEVHLQAIYVDSGAPFEVSATNGLRVIVG